MKLLLPRNVSKDPRSIRAHKKFKKFIGKKIGKRKILKLSYRHSRWHFFVQCDCGSKSFVSTGGGLLKGKASSCGQGLCNLRIPRLHGKNFGFLTVLSFKDISKYGHSRWLCKCICGKIIVREKQSITEGKYPSCGCKLPEILSNCNRMYSREDSKLRKVYRSYAKRNKFYEDTMMSFEEWKKLIKLPCYYCGTPPSNSARGVLYSGLDRVNTDRGYTVDNCVSCCKLHNFIKGRVTIDIIKKAYEFLCLD